jgi:hypothetical protein
VKALIAASRPLRVAALFLDVCEEVEDQLGVDLLDAEWEGLVPRRLLTKVNKSRKACA